MVTHDPAAAATADRVVFLRDGRLAGEVEGGSHAAVAEYLATLQTDARAGRGRVRPRCCARSTPSRCASCERGRCAPLLTAFGVVLGVGMVFGVLLLVGTIRATFDDLIDSAWGETDLIVDGRGQRDARRRARASRRSTGVRDAGGMVGGMFTRLERDGSRWRAPRARCWSRATTPRATSRTTSARRGPASPRGVEVMVERNWARDRGLRASATASASPAPTGAGELPIVGIFQFSSGLRRRPRVRRDAARGRAPAVRPAEGLDADRDRGDGPRRGRGGPAPRRARARRRRATCRPRRGLGRGRASSSQALNIVLYFFSGVALFVGGFLILNSFNMTVLQRMRELGMLRTLGASRADGDGRCLSRRSCWARSARSSGSRSGSAWPPG